MEKRLLAGLIGMVMAVSLAACSGSSKASTQTDTEETVSKEPEAENAEETSSEETAEKEEKFTDLASIIDSISKDVEDTSAKLEKEWKTIEANTDSYDNYKNIKDEALGFFDFCENESTNLYERMNEKEVAYFKLIVESGAIDEYKEWDDAMGDFYDEWDDAMGDYYDAWDDLYGDAYDHFDDIITSDSVSNYEEYSEAWQEVYDKYSESWASMYEKYSDAWADGYAAYSDVWAGFYAGEKDVDKIISDGKTAREEAAKASTEEASSEEEASASDEVEEAAEAEESEDEKATESEDSGDEIDPDFKAAMDGYEKFFDEYCEFMTKYAEADSTTQLGMMADYAELMATYSETMEEMDNMDTDSMNDAELKYYIEVTTRIQEKLMKVSVDIGG